MLKEKKIGRWIWGLSMLAILLLALPASGEALEGEEWWPLTEKILIDLLEWLRSTIDTLRTTLPDPDYGPFPDPAG